MGEADSSSISVLQLVEREKGMKERKREKEKFGGEKCE